MCSFFSFISDGKGNVYYFSPKQRRSKRLANGRYNFDSHTSIAEYYFKDAHADDCVNKYEYNNGPHSGLKSKHGRFVVNQINAIDDDTNKVIEWFKEFIESDEFIELCLQEVKKNPLVVGLIPKERLTREICNKAFDANWLCLVKIPDKFKTKKMFDYSTDIY